MRNFMKYSFVFLVAISALSTAIVTGSIHSSLAADVQQIKPEELKKLIESNDPNFLVVDTQPKGAYELGHIKGAINFPWAMDIQNPGNLPENKTLILYCDCAHEEDSTDISGQVTSEFPFCTSTDDSIDVAEQLMTKFGFRNIKVLEGGWSRWQQLGYPTDKK
jgi:rhodanese-related sulfurtransferase